MELIGEPMSYCAGKRKYRSIELALDALDAIKAKNNDAQRHKNLKPYRCAICDHWHIGHDHKKAAIIAKPKGPKEPTPGQLRRARRRAAEKAVRAFLWQDRVETLRYLQAAVDREMQAYAAAGRQKVAPQPM